MKKHMNLNLIVFVSELYILVNSFSFEFFIFKTFFSDKAKILQA